MKFLSLLFARFRGKPSHTCHFIGDIDTAKFAGILKGSNIYSYKTTCSCGLTKVEMTNKLWEV